MMPGHLPLYNQCTGEGIQLDEVVINMMEAEEVPEILRCPVCAGWFRGNLVCSGCKRRFSANSGIYIMIDEELSEFQWQWDERIVSQDYRKEVLDSYERLLSPEVRKAYDQWWNAVYPKLDSLSGVVVDLATGLGTMLEKVLARSEAEVYATDIDPNILLSTKKDFDRKYANKATYVATDIKHLAIKNNSVDYVTSFAGINNITDTAITTYEFYRILKKGGRGILMSAFVDRDTPTAELAEDYGFIEAYIREDFISLLEGVGFDVVEDIEASSVVWKENEMDIFPIEGDTVYYHVLEVEK